MNRKPVIGDDVIYVAAGGVKLAAKVVHIWNAEMGMVNCVVFGDGVNVRETISTKTSVDCDQAGERINTWHFPPPFVQGEPS